MGMSLDGRLYLVLEYAAHGATMEWDSNKCSYFASKSQPLIREATAKTYVLDALNGLSYLHSLFIAHRDIKPQNLLVNAHDRIKIGDFGVAIEMGEDCKVDGTEGTYYFYAPEMCRSGYNGHDGRLADIWALGVTLWAFFYGSVPFFKTDLYQLLESIGEAKYTIPSQPRIG